MLARARTLAQVAAANLSPFILRADGRAVRRKLPFVYAPPEADTGPLPPAAPPPDLEAAAHPAQPSRRGPPPQWSAPPGREPVRSGLAEEQQQGLQGGPRVEQQGEGPQAAQGTEAGAEAEAGGAASPGAEQWRGRGGPGGAGPHHESHLSRYVTVKPRGRTDVLAQVHTARTHACTHVAACVRLPPAQ